MKIGQSIKTVVKNHLAAVIADANTCFLIFYSELQAEMVSIGGTLSYSNDAGAYVFVSVTGSTVNVAGTVYSFSIVDGSNELFKGLVTASGYGGDIEFETTSWLKGSLINVAQVTIKEIE